MARCVCRVHVAVVAGLPLQLLVVGVVVAAVVAAGAAAAVVQLLHSLLPFCLSVAV